MALSKYYKVPAINRLLKIIAELPENPSHNVKGGVLGVLDLGSPPCSIKQAVGEILDTDAYSYFGIVNGLIEDSKIGSGKVLRSPGTVAENSFGQSFLYGNYIVAFIGYADKRLNEAFSLVYNLYLNSFGEKVSIEAFKAIAFEIINDHCSDEMLVKIILDQFLEWYQRIELSEGEKIKILVIDENEEWLDRITSSLQCYNIFDVSSVEYMNNIDRIIEKVQSENPSEDPHVIFCTQTLKQSNGSLKSSEVLKTENNKIIYMVDNDREKSHLPRLVKADFKHQEGLLEDPLTHHLIEAVLNVLGI